MSTTSWIDQSVNVNAPKRKRAGLVCVACHEKKIRCDLQSRDNAGCTHCATTGQECRHRPSKRGNNRGGSQRPQPSQVPSPPVPQPQPANEDENALCTPPQSAATNERMSIDYTHSTVQARTNEAYPTFTHGGNYLYPMPAANHNGTSVTSQLGIVPRTEQSWSEASPQSSRNKNSEPYITESGFLQVYSREHRDYTSGEGVVPGDGSLTPDVADPDLLQSFIETYFRSCYAWCPVLDRETLPNDLARSPLLVNAISLAGTHIRPPIIPSTKPATYYSRAKQMFYNDEEVDPITCLQSICLFYWWSPRPSSQLHRDSAWWWTALNVRQAQQVGFHRELKPGHPGNAGVNYGLRRRIWWTLFVSELILSYYTLLINIVGSGAHNCDMSGSAMSY